MKKKPIHEYKSTQVVSKSKTTKPGQSEVQPFKNKQSMSASSFSNSITLKSLKGSSNEVANVCTITADRDGYTVKSVPSDAMAINSVLYVCEDLKVNGTSVPTKIADNAAALSTLATELNGAIDAKVTALGQEYGASEVYTDTDGVAQQGKLYVAKSDHGTAEANLTTMENDAKTNLTARQSEIGNFKTEMTGFFVDRDADMTSITTNLEQEKFNCAKSVKDIMIKIRDAYAAQTDSLLSTVKSKEEELETARESAWHDETNTDSHKSKLDGILSTHQTDIKTLINTLESNMNAYVTETFVDFGTDKIKTKLQQLTTDIEAIRSGLGTDEGERLTLQKVIADNREVDAEVASNMDILEDNVQTLWAEMLELSSQFDGLFSANGGSTGNFEQFDDAYVTYSSQVASESTSAV